MVIELLLLISFILMLGMVVREDLAHDMCTKDGREWDKLPDVLKNAYLHNADTEIERPPDATPEAPIPAPLTADEEAIIRTSRLNRAKSREVQDEEPPEVEKAPEPKKKKARAGGPWRDAKPGEYYCAKCGQYHKETSKIGVKHG